MKSFFITTSALLIVFGAIWAVSAYTTHVFADAKTISVNEDLMNEKPENLPHVTIAGGCFWCVESEFRTLNGVKFTLVGYAGGETQNPSYQEVVSGRTGHAEALQVYYDPEIISKEDILTHFLTTAHNPTTLNQQWVDRGEQYRSVIFYEDEGEKDLAQRLIKEIDASNVWEDKIVTTLEPLSTFWIGEEYHQQYYEKYKEKTGRDHIRILSKPKYGKNKK